MGHGRIIGYLARSTLRAMGDVRPSQFLMLRFAWPIFRRAAASEESKTASGMQAQGVV